MWWRPRLGMPMHPTQPREDGLLRSALAIPACDIIISQPIPADDQITLPVLDKVARICTSARPSRNQGRGCDRAPPRVRIRFAAPVITTPSYDPMKGHRRRASGGAHARRTCNGGETAQLRLDLHRPGRKRGLFGQMLRHKTTPCRPWRTGAIPPGSGSAPISRPARINGWTRARRRRRPRRCARA